MSSVIIHKVRKIREPKHEPTSEELTAKRSAADAENQFEFKTHIPRYIGGYYEAPEKVQQLIRVMLETKIYNKSRHMKALKCNPSNIHILIEYIKMVRRGELQPSAELEQALRLGVRGDSGVHVYTLVMSDRPFKIVDGQRKETNFTCKWDCAYCPKQPGMPRSYINSEPAVARGDQFNWDPRAQIYNRFMSYIASGQVSAFIAAATKGEFILEGGTYSSYPKEYREWFITMIYYTCNTIYDDLPRREPRSLLEEMRINETCTGIRVVGLSIETRPDCITRELMHELRTLGVTKVQIGVQHLDDQIMKKMRRRCTTQQVRNAMRILLDYGFKVQIHIMPDLPGSNPELDIAMFRELFSSEEYGFDHIKVYPTMIVDYTQIKKWYEDGSYKPYGDDPNAMLEVLVAMVQIMNECQRFDIRKERIIRDIPEFEVIGGIRDTGMGGTLSIECKKRGIACCCIRCREVKNHAICVEPELVVRERTMCGGREIFISYESPDRQTIYGFLRLRIKNSIPKYYNNDYKFDGDSIDPLLAELDQSAIIRELHVYGTASTVAGIQTNAQHRGFGGRLVQKAKEIALSHGLKKITVIAGNGVKEYYSEKHGFRDQTYYMVCDL